MKTGSLVLGLVAGVAVGATLGVLFAPDKGSKTRRKIMNRGGDYADEVKEKFSDLLNTITEKYETVMQEAESLVAKGKAKVNEIKKDTNSVTSHATM